MNRPKIRGSELCGNCGRFPRRNPRGGYCVTCDRAYQKGRRCALGIHPRIPAEERFWKKVEKTEGCWLWRGTLWSNGYGMFTVPRAWRKDGKKSLMAHRYSWELANGEIPGGLILLHSCDVRNCVRPDHLTPGTYLENMADMKSRGRSARGEARPFAKLTDAKVVELRRLHSEGWTYERLGERYGVSRSCAHHVGIGRTWSHVPGDLSPHRVRLGRSSSR